MLCGCSQEEKPMKVTPNISLNKTDSMIMLDVYDKTGGGVYWGESWDRRDYHTWTDVKTEEIDGFPLLLLAVCPLLLES